MIIPIHRVVTTQYPVGTTIKASGIEAGHAVCLDSNGYAIQSNGSSPCVGLAADRIRASEANEWVNRVSDSGNETAASGYLTVYSRGEFWVDVDDNSITTPLGTVIDGVVVDDAATINDTAYAIAAGKIDDSGSVAIGYFLSGETTLESGIPGEYEPGSSVGYADDATPRSWVKIKFDV